jgi:hypothetical protein
MTTANEEATRRAEQRQRALQRWDNEGGAGPGRLPADEDLDTVLRSAPPLSNAELVQLHVRLIAVENVLIALLAQADDAQRGLIRDMAAYISPRPGFTPHPMTIGAAGEMVSLLERSNHFRPTRTGTGDL